MLGPPKSASVPGTLIDRSYFQTFWKSEETEPAAEGEVIEEQSEDSSDKEWLPGSNWLSICDNPKELFPTKSFPKQYCSLYIK